MLNKMEEDLKLIRSQLSSLCEAFTQVKDCAKLILGRLDSQDDRLDQITKQLAHIFDSSNNEKTSFKALKYASDKQANASSPALTNMGVAPQSLNLIDKVKEPLPEIAPLVTSKSSPSLHTNENSKKGKKYTKKRAKSSVPPCRQRINRHIKRKIADELQDKEKIRPRPDAIETKQEKKKSHFPAKKISCESGVFSSDELYSEDCTDEVIYETALSEEEIDIPQPATIEHGQLNASDSLATGQNASEVINTQSQQQKPEQRQSPVPHKSEPRPDFGSRQQSDSEQTQNLNRAGSQSPGCVVTQPQENNIRDQSDVTVAVYQAVGADNANKGDKGPLGHVEMFLAPAQPHKLPEGRRASYAGLTTNEKQTAQHKLENKDEGADMTPATIPTGEITRAHSSCDIRRNDTMKSDSGDMCIDRRLIDVKRQFSDSSTSSAPGGIQITIGADTDSDEEQIEIALPSIPAPAFSYRSVTVKNSTYKHFYDLKEQLGGGRFGKVYRCVEKKTGLQLAAKCFVCKKPVAKSLLKSKSLKRSPNNLKTKRTQQEPVDKEDVMIEIAIMNLIDHENVVKLYDAFENDNAMTLIMEYLSGGELFERVIADQSQLTELDAVLFMQQITKAVQYLHKNLILHLDLKPENILCLNRTTHHLKIIDFGLARKYKPRQKLVVQWGTPEFMAPEVLNYEVVSFASDMWSMGVICYILLSGISPFLGDCDSDTMENIADCAWDFEEEPFQIVSEEGKDFISRLLVAEKSGRMSATQCLRHEWLSTPLTSRRRKALMNKNKLKVFLARMHWKAGIAAVTAANWLKSKVNTENDIESAV